MARIRTPHETTTAMMIVLLLLLEPESESVEEVAAVDFWMADFWLANEVTEKDESTVEASSPRIPDAL